MIEQHLKFPDFRRYSLCIYYYYRRIRGTIPPLPLPRNYMDGNWWVDEEEC